MKYLSFIMLFILQNSVFSQTIEIDSINFYDEQKFEHAISYRPNGKTKLIEYNSVSSQLKKVEYYDSKSRLTKDQIWNDTLLKEIRYTYLEKGQIIKIYDVMKEDLKIFLDIDIKYPALARENGIEGKILIEFLYDDSCIPIDFKVLNNIGADFDKEVKSKMNLFISLSQKYEVDIENCLTKDTPFTLKFELK